MKTKTFGKKLTLNKETVTRLENGEMVKIQAGWIATAYTGPVLCCIPILTEPLCPIT